MLNLKYNKIKINQKRRIARTGTS